MLSLDLFAEMKGVTGLLPVDTEETPFLYSFKVRCISCREVHPNLITISRFEVQDSPSGRGKANLIWRCNFCKRQNTAYIVEDPVAYTNTSPPQKQTILKIDCRGLELFEFDPRGTWLCKSDSESVQASKFVGVDLSENEWFDYDEAAKSEVSITSVKWSIGVV